MKPEDTAAILGELERVVGFLECNQLVIGLLRGALAAELVWEYERDSNKTKIK